MPSYRWSLAAADTVNSETILYDNKRNASSTFSWQIAIVDKSFSICTITHLYDENECKTSAPAYESSFIPQRRAANIVLSAWFAWIERASGATQRTTVNNIIWLLKTLLHKYELMHLPVEIRQKEMNLGFWKKIRQPWAWGDPSNVLKKIKIVVLKMQSGYVTSAVLKTIFLGCCQNLDDMQSVHEQKNISSSVISDQWSQLIFLLGFTPDWSRPGVAVTSISGLLITADCDRKSLKSYDYTSATEINSKLNYLFAGNITHTSKIPFKTIIINIY